MSAAKNTVRIQRMCVAALLCAIAILIPMISPVKIQLGPMSFTLGSHVAIFIAMFISPAVALTVELGATLGFLLAGFPPVVVLRALSQVVFVAIGAFLLAKKPAVMKNGLSIFLFGLVMGVIHGVLEAVVVTAFWFSGMTMEGTFVSTVLGLVGVGSIARRAAEMFRGRGHSGAQHGGLLPGAADLAAGVPRGKAARELHIFKELSIPEGF